MYKLILIIIMKLQIKTRNMEYNLFISLDDSISWLNVYCPIALTVFPLRVI